MAGGRKGVLSGPLRGADLAVQAADKAKRRRDPTLPPDSEEGYGAGPLREGQVKARGEGATDLLDAEERRLRDKFYDLKPRDRRGERLLGRRSEFAPYFRAERRLEQDRKTASPFVPGDPELRVKRKKKPPAAATTVTIDGKKYKVGDTKQIEQARARARLKEKLLARPKVSRDIGRAETGLDMKAGGLKTKAREKRKIAEAYAEYMKPSSVKKRKKNVKTAASAKRKRITENIMSAAKGGMAGKKPRNANIDYRKKGMFYVGGMSAKTTPINKGKK